MCRLHLTAAPLAVPKRNETGSREQLRDDVRTSTVDVDVSQTASRLMHALLSQKNTNNITRLRGR
jgi:hypothetical protein